MSNFAGNKVNSEWAENAYINLDKYQKLYDASLTSPEKFWAAEGKRIDWIKPYTIIKNTSYKKNNINIRWFEDGTLNVSANCIDRHLEKNSNKKAIIWESDDGEETRTYTYKDLYKHVCKFANILKKLNSLSEDSAKPKIDFRDFGIGAQILHDLDISKVNLLSNSKQKHRVGLSGYGLSIVNYTKY